MQRDLTYIIDIYKSAMEALSYIEDCEFAEFMQNREKQNACIRLLEVIGEAARRVSAQTKQEHPMLVWGEMIMMRNKLIHEYSRVDPAVVWETLTDDLPELLEQIKRSFPHVDF